MRVTSKFLMATTALALMVGYGAHAADEAKKKTAAPKQVVSKEVEVPPTTSNITPPLGGIQPPTGAPMGQMGQMGQMGGMPMGQPSMGQPMMGQPMLTPPAGAIAMSASQAPMQYYYGKPMYEMQENMMRVRPTGDADFDFVQAMLPHHRGAIDMARIVLEKGKDPEIKKLATEILKAQEAEIKLMSDWIGKQQAKKSGTN